MLATPPIPFHHTGTKDDGFIVNVVSAEGASYCVDHQKLVSASTVFRHLITSSVVHVSEPSSSLGPLLDVLMGDTPVFPVVNERASILGRSLELMRLLIKYDCNPALTYAVTSLKCMAMEHDVCPLEVFILGAAIEDITLCRTAIVFSDRDDITNVDAEIANTIQGHWSAVPAKYKKALMGAWEAKDPKDRGNRFAEAMYLKDNKAEISHVEKIPPVPLVKVTAPLVKVTVTPVHLHYSIQAKRHQIVNRFEVDDDPFASDDDE